MEPRWRKHTRSSLDIPLELTGKVSSLSQNISQSGMLCWTSKQIEELTLLDIKFQLPQLKGIPTTTTWIECSGVVVRCEKKEQEKRGLPYEVAIFFNDISDQNRSILMDYIAGES